MNTMQGGLQSGGVKAVANDPDGEFRVQIVLPLIQKDAVWARLSTLYASNKVGGVFYPSKDQHGTLLPGTGPRAPRGCSDRPSRH